MNDRIVTPVGRLVQGSLYEPQTKDILGQPLVIKSGVDKGKPTVKYYFGIAIPKGSETHWNQTEWGSKIWNVGQSGFPGGQSKLPDFAWKIKDGDSAIPDKTGKRPCDREGHLGHWILNFSSAFKPTIVNRDGSGYLLDDNYINLGDYVQVAASISANESLQNPGVFLNHTHVSFQGYGQRIILGIDPKSLGFGNAPLPTGVSQTPVTPIGTTAAPLPNNLPPPSINLPSPHHAILNPPTPAPRAMLPAANGVSYEQYLAAGWTDQQLIQHGLMSA